MGYDSKGILMFNLKYEHAISFINLVKFINYQMPRSISSKLFVIASGGGEANVYGSSYYWNFRTSACLILYLKACLKMVIFSSYVRRSLPFVSRFTSMPVKTIIYYFPIICIFITIKKEMVRIFTWCATVTESIW